MNQQTIRIPIPREAVRMLLFELRNANDNNACVMVRGYNEDYDNFTGVYWEEGCGWEEQIDAFDLTYEDFELWITFEPEIHNV